MANPIVSAILGVIDGPLDRLLGRFFPNADDRQKAKLEMQATLIEQEGTLQAKVLELQQAQIEVNKVEAAHASLFVAGWRPYVGWTCGFAMTWQYVLQPFAAFFLTIAQGIWKFDVPPLPVLDNSQMITVLLGLLGLGGLRTYEKIKGEVDRSSLKEP